MSVTARGVRVGRALVSAGRALAPGLLLLLSAPAPAAAAEFRAVGVPAAVLYDAPSRQGRKLFVAPRGMPLEVVSTLGQWVKVRDMTGEVVWIERSELADRRNVVSTTVLAVRQSAQDGAPVVLQVDRGVLLELVADTQGAAPAPSGWVRVRHRDGGTGFVRAADVFGL